jgi:hypothetical protein
MQKLPNFPFPWGNILLLFFLAKRRGDPDRLKEEEKERKLNFFFLYLSSPLKEIRNLMKVSVLWRVKR